MRGERERVADRVRELLGAPAPDVSGRHRYRWAAGRRSVAALGLALVVVVAVTVWWVASSRPTSVPVSAVNTVPAGPLLSAPSSAVESQPSSSSTSAATIVVDVAGKVVRPGIYRLPAGARVFDAVQAAGGARAGVDTVTINLAAPLQDGEQVVVGVSGAPAPAPPVAGGAESSAPTVVNLNSATLEELETLPGVGPVLGQHILDWRSAHGSFDTIDQLNEVSGIGEVTFGELRDLVTV